MRDEDGWCGVCKFKPFEERYSPDFLEWVGNLIRLYQWRQAGCPLPDGLEFEELQALAIIARYYEVKDKEDLARAIQLQVLPQ